MSIAELTETAQERLSPLERLELLCDDGSLETIRSGVVYGFAGQVDGIVKAIRDELGTPARAIATGGLAELIAPHAGTIELVDPFLTLEGLRLVWERNR